MKIRISVRTAAAIAVAAVAVIIIALLVSSGHLARPDAEEVRDFLERARGTPWALPLVCALYVLGGFILFPVTVMNLATAMVFGALWGVIYGLIGAMLEAVVFYGLGHMAGQGFFRSLPEKGMVRNIDRKLRDSGVIGLTTLRFLPIAPYSLFNFVAGASSITFLVYTTGTFLALLPGAIARGLVGDSLMQVFLDPTPARMAYLAAGISFWVFVILVTHKLAQRWQKRHGKEITGAS